MARIDGVLEEVSHYGATSSRLWTKSWADRPVCQRTENARAAGELRAQSAKCVGSTCWRVRAWTIAEREVNSARSEMHDARHACRACFERLIGKFDKHYAGSAIPTLFKNLQKCEFLVQVVRDERMAQRAVQRCCASQTGAFR